MKATFLQSLFKIVSLAFCVVVCFGCSDSAETEKSNKITGEDICWKLIKVVENGNVISNIEELSHNKTSKIFTLSFEGDGNFKKNGKFGGFSSTNTIEGTYTTDDTNSTIHLQIERTTEIIESEFGNRYMRDILPTINTWEYVDGCLNLHYANNSYLKYELINKGL